VDQARDDDALVQAAKTGDERAFESLVAQHRGRIRATCARILSDPASCDDCEQQTLMQAWRALARFDGRSRFSTWLYRVAANEALQILRRRRPQELLVDDLPPLAADDAPGPGIEGVERERVRMIVRRRLAELPDTLRVAVVLRDIEEWSNEEVAEALGVSVPAAKARIHRGRMRLRELLVADLPELR
jgi:RNA polymerase sigma-70 factor (ECF subfamily)